jgi:GNAT superfamily N-acetyltransferase
MQREQAETHADEAEHAHDVSDHARVRRDWRGQGIAIYLKRHTLYWAAASGLTEHRTWTQRDNHAMRRLNEALDYTCGQQSITVTRPLPM